MNKKRLSILLAVLLLAAVIVSLTLYFASKTEAIRTYTEYTVKAGDTCSKIASDHNVSAESFIEMNNLAPDCSNLTIGQKLVIPESAP
ncbi:MAG: LysM peptidoglycan-binding domain-containing protein [Anaerolineaceae bacterium]